MMVRTQITLSGEAHRAAKLRAAELGLSLAEYIRRLVTRDLGEQRAPDDVTEIFDLFDSGGSDVARHKDAYVHAAVAAEHERADLRSRA